MRLSALTLIGALGLAVSSVSASAAPVAPALDIQLGANLVQVAGGCRWGLHPNRWGHCVPNRYGYASPRPYYGGRYYGGGWNSPGDNVANQLNAQELGRNYYGSSMPYR
jgi:hypothetical protein